MGRDYSAWTSWNQSLTACLSNVEPTQYAPPDVQCISSFGLNWGSAYSQLKSRQQDSVTWQNRVKGACPSFQPSPAPSPPGPQNPVTPGGGGGGGAPSQSWLCTTLGINCGSGSSPSDSSSVGWPDALKWMAILGIGAMVVWYIGPLIATIAGVGAGAIRKRASGSDEFEPVHVRGGDYGNLKIGFGDMAIAPPTLEALQFGDVQRDDVLALLASGQE